MRGLECSHYHVISPLQGVIPFLTRCLLFVYLRRLKCDCPSFTDCSTVASCLLTLVQVCTYVKTWLADHVHSEYTIVYRMFYLLSFVSLSYHMHILSTAGFNEFHCYILVDIVKEFYISHSSQNVSKGHITPTVRNNA